MEGEALQQVQIIVYNLILMFEYFLLSLELLPKFDLLHADVSIKMTLALFLLLLKLFDLSINLLVRLLRLVSPLIFSLENELLTFLAHFDGQ